MASATDIITYIGIPLAVLGVLPILYTFFLSIFTQRRIRHLLVTHGHRPRRAQTRQAEEDGFTLRASPMTSLIEVEMPRYTIAPLERADERYWAVNTGGRVGHGAREGEAHQLLDRMESTLSMLEEGRVKGFLRGGSWRSFNWRKLVVGRKMYRIQYEDELREPPAEIDFTDLVNFLMDWGVELDGMGWEKLRSGGLWTPSGTVLLRLPAETGTVVVEGKEGSSRGTLVDGRGDWVLRTSVPDESDGILSLCVKWPQARDNRSIRNGVSLPPGWGRLTRPASMDAEDEPESKEGLLAAIAALEEGNDKFMGSDSVRFKLDGEVVSKIYIESSGSETGFVGELFRMSRFILGLEWFTSAASAILTLKKDSGSLWGFEHPSEIINFARKDSIPCGVLVILEILPEEQAPQWTTNSGSSYIANNFGQLQIRQMEARRQAERLEATMPPEQARVHRANRQVQEIREQHENMQSRLRKQQEWQLQRLQDASVSSRVTNKSAADLCLKWLIDRRRVAPDSTVTSVAESALYLLVLQSQLKENGEDDGTPTKETMPVLRILEEWTGWTQAGGMKKDHFDLLERHKEEFCYAVCVVASVHEAALVSTGHGKASVDMLECLRMWRKVRLG